MGALSWTHYLPFVVKFTDQVSALPAEVRTFVTRFKTLSGPRSDDQYLQLLFNLVVNISNELDRPELKGAPLNISVTGAQGSGKSTLAGMLAKVLLEGFGVSGNVISLDDFYLSKDDRSRLAARVHPMLATRGVPGTHDVDWMSDVLEAHRNNVSIECPVFDKATDDRLSSRRLLSPAQVLICEGWCWGAKPEPTERLDTAVNRLEASQDPEGKWRRFVNAELARYQSVFKTDAQIYLKVPSMASIIRWRWQQEQELANSADGLGLTPELTQGRSPGQGLRTEKDVAGFVEFYERLTRWMLTEMPGRTDVLVSLSEDHHIDRVTLR